jgi:putative spermidine/putrescine transport system ATP-binding protein
MAYLEIRQVRKEFNAAVAVERFNLEMPRGEFVSFLGPSGCGKTTTLRMVAGFEQPTEGTIVINNKDLTRVPASKRHIGMVFQSYGLFPNMTVANNIKFGMKIAKESTAVQEKRLRDLLGIIKMGDFANRYPHQLSGGQQQRVALARALAIQPDVLLLDEPLSALDAKIRIVLRQEIRAIQRQLGTTTIYVTHDQEEALSISDRIVVMNKGRIEQVGTPLEIYNAPQTRFVAQFVGTLNILTGPLQDPKTVQIDGQAIRFEKPAPSPSGTVTLALRPESITLADSTPQNGSNQLVGTAEDVSFLGSVVRIGVRLKDQRINFDTFNNPSLVPPPIGAPLTVRFAPESVMLLRDE